MFRSYFWWHSFRCSDFPLGNLPRHYWGVDFSGDAHQLPLHRAVWSEPPKSTCFGCFGHRPGELHKSLCKGHLSGHLFSAVAKFTDNRGGLRYNELNDRSENEKILRERRQELCRLICRQVTSAFENIDHLKILTILKHWAFKNLNIWKHWAFKKLNIWKHWVSENIDYLKILTIWQQ